VSQKSKSGHQTIAGHVKDLTAVIFHDSEQHTKEPLQTREYLGRRHSFRQSRVAAQICEKHGCLHDLRRLRLHGRGNITRERCQKIDLHKHHSFSR
jgi:hypothetical protein